MKRALQIIGSILAVLLVSSAALFFWASTGRLADEDLAQTKMYDSSSTAPERDTLTVMTYNIGYLSGMTNNEPLVRGDSFFFANMEQAVGFIREANPHVIGFQEIDLGAARSAYVHQLDTIATRLGYVSAAQAVNWDERYIPFPYGRPAVHFGRVVSGQALLSHYPIRQHVREVLARPPQPFFRDAFYLDRLAQVGVIEAGGRPLGIVNVHLEAFDTDTRERQARAVNALYQRLAKHDLPVLVLGDFNSTLTSPHQAADSTLRLLLEGTGLRPARGDSATATYPADAPTERLDYIFYPPRFATPIRTQRLCGAPRPPSDHCAIAATFHVAPPSEEWPTDKQVPSLDRLLHE